MRHRSPAASYIGVFPGAQLCKATTSTLHTPRKCCSADGEQGLAKLAAALEPYSAIAFISQVLVTLPLTCQLLALECSCQASRARHAMGGDPWPVLLNSSPFCPQEAPSRSSLVGGHLHGHVQVAAFQHALHICVGQPRGLAAALPERRLHCRLHLLVPAAAAARARGRRLRGGRRICTAHGRAVCPGSPVVVALLGVIASPEREILGPRSRAPPCGTSAALAERDPTAAGACSLSPHPGATQQGRDSALRLKGRNGTLVGAGLIPERRQRPLA